MAARRGIAHHKAKLTPDAVRECRARYRSGEIMLDLANEYDVSPGTMRAAIRGITWAHIDD